jgi:hypothetical protein
MAHIMSLAPNAPAIFDLVPASDRPDLRAEARRLSDLSWPAFLDANGPTQDHWNGLFDAPLAQFQFYALTTDAQGREVMAGASNSIPFFAPTPADDASLPDGGWDEVIGMGSEPGGPRPNALSALAVMVFPEFRDTPVAELLIRNMRTTALAHGLSALVVPVRPTRKKDYPLTSFADYVAWQNDRDEPFDPWVRKHWRLGARIAKIAPGSMLVDAPLADWQRWTGLRFPVPGLYHVPGGLAPILVDEKLERGVYREPNLWMRHPL